ncbi:hypothetical protein G7046_g1319 [Stylonectria norvegica]|nr:hypothetical protein G7046_g1319 [Stylonectria norvegica]
MGILFSRPGQDSDVLPATAYPVGSVASINASAVAPYLGINYGLYGGIPTSDLPTVPFEWMISPSHAIEATSCPTASNILLMFGVTEVFIIALTPVFAYRPLIHYLSRGYFGRRKKASPALTWTISFLCQLLANAIIAGLVGNTPGYGHLNMLHIFTLYMTRPRVTSVIMALLRSLVGVKRPRRMDKTNIIRRRTDNGIEFPYTDAYIATVSAEFFVLLISAVFTGVTWHRLPTTSKAREYMYDIVAYVSSAPAVLLLCMVAFVPVHKRYGDAFPLEGRRYKITRQWHATVAPDGQASLTVLDKTHKKVYIKRAVSAVASALLMGYISLVQWSYWQRFLKLPGVLFCPPKMAETAVIWTIFTLVGTLAGAAS